jgi:hypothetical protein
MLRKFLLSGLVLCLAIPAFAKGGGGGGSQPTCLLPPTGVHQDYYFDCDDEVRITWAAPACSGITKYAVEVTVSFVPPGGYLNCPDPAYVQTFSFTTPDATPQIDILFSDLNTFDFIEEVWCAPASVKVKALTAPSGGNNNRSQNNPFSDPSTAFSFACF